MQPKTVIFLSVCILIAAAALGDASTAFAQDLKGSTEPSRSTCSECHAALYTIHDTGKWYCNCKRQADCVVCHSGQAGTMDKDVSHTGLIIHPVRDNLAACQGCHPLDYPQRVERFALIAGLAPVHTPAPTYTPPKYVSTASGIQASGTNFLLRILSPWQLVGLGGVIGSFMGVLLFGCRCWKQDREAGRL